MPAGCEEHDVGGQHDEQRAIEHLPLHEGKYRYGCVVEKGGYGASGVQVLAGRFDLEYERGTVDRGRHQRPRNERCRPHVERAVELHVVDREFLSGTAAGSAERGGEKEPKR